MRLATAVMVLEDETARNQSTVEMNPNQEKLFELRFKDSTNVPRTAATPTYSTDETKVSTAQPLKITQLDKSLRGSAVGSMKPNCLLFVPGAV